MSHDDSYRLQAVLSAWAASVTADGDVPPTEADLEMISVAMSVRPEASPAVERWQPVLQYFVTQVSMGVADISPRVPSRILAKISPPSGSPLGGVKEGTAPDGGSDTSSGRPVEFIDRLKQWRQERGEAGDRAVAQLTETQLALINRLLQRSDSETNLRRRLPGPARPYLEALRTLRSSHDVNTVDVASEVAATEGPSVESASPRAARATARESDPPDVSSADADGTVSTSSDAERELSTETPFARYRGDVPDGPTQPLAVDSSAGVVRVTWAAASSTERVVIYRLVARDDYRPFAPESARTLAVTTEVTAVDLRPQATILRWVQVWVNEGRDLRAAQKSQPRLYADGVVVNGLHQPSVVARDDGLVVGQWAAPLGAKEVRIYRIPAEQLHALTGTSLHSFQLDPADPHLGGFVDREAVGGRSYVYRLQVVAVDGGQEHVGPALDLEATTVGRLEAVDDLEVTRRSDGLLDLVWTAPQLGQVRIYWTAAEPEAGSDHRELGIGALQSTVLVGANEIRHPYEPVDASGRSRWSGVAWPEGHTRVVVTPVTVVGDRLIIGTSRREIRVPPIAELRLNERVTDQTLTFAWPAGASAVYLHKVAMGADPAQAAQARPVQEVTLTGYQRLGGVHLNLRPEDECRIVATAVVFSGGVPLTGPPAWVDRESLLVLHYTCDQKRRIVGKPTHALVRVWSDSETKGSPAFVCVLNRDRLPLHDEDGQRLIVRPSATPDAPAALTFKPQSLDRGAATEWRVDLSGAGPRGCLRVFPVLAPNMLTRVAVMDPRVDDLKLGDW